MQETDTEEIFVNKEREGYTDYLCAHEQQCFNE